MRYTEEFTEAVGVLQRALRDHNNDQPGAVCAALVVQAGRLRVVLSRDVQEVENKADDGYWTTQYPNVIAKLSEAGG